MRKYIDYKEFEELCYALINKVNSTNKKYNGVYGVPKNGSLVSLFVAKFFTLKVLDKPQDGCLIVDDIIESGKTKEKYNDIVADFFALIDKREPEWKGVWIDWWFEKEEEGIEDNIVRILEYMGEDPNREGLKDTPKRVKKAYDELFKGYKSEAPALTSFPNDDDGIRVDSMIIDSGEFNSFCEHHMMSFSGQYYFAYIPSDKVVGLSKIARVVDYFSARLQVQERLTKQIVDYIEKELNPKGIALIMKANHTCKSMRGIKKQNGAMVTSEMRGRFMESQDTRNEFLRLIELK